jgi:hypothetical protein
MEFKKDYIYKIEDNHYGGNFLMLVIDIDDYPDFPVITEFLSEMTGDNEQYGNRWHLECDEDITTLIGHKDDYPEYLI